MNFLPSFVAWPFAAAGLIAATGPIVIHLLNRRRHRTVHWAAMEFLREAFKRNRRILQIRDLLLLLLRTLAVLLIGLALARPFFSAGNEAFDGSQPLHAVLIVDNSLSMGFESLGGTSLDRAKQRARRFIGRLPTDSRVTVIPLCGSRFGHSRDAASKDAAMESLDRIEIVDRSASIRQVINQAIDVRDADSSLSMRLVFFSDQQESVWQDAVGRSGTDELPTLQAVDVSADQPENTWISDLRLQDGLADIETPATLIVAVRHQGHQTRRDVEVQLHVDGVQVAAKTVSLEAGQGAREVTFQHRFDAFHPEPGAALAVPVTASISPDSLPEDDTRCLVVPVVAGLPVVFVDQYGDNREDPIKNRIGETRHLRRLLAPSTSRVDNPRQLIEVRHIGLDQLTRETLEDVRLVVVAGIASPDDRVALLREYVQQGGQLVIAAGGVDDPANNAGFDPADWTANAWLDGAGILPAPLLPEPVGATLDEAGAADLEPFFLSYDSMATHGYFQLAGVGEQELQDLYAEPLFFKAVRTNLDPQVLQQLRASEVRRLDAMHPAGS
ncbi:MAG: BatA domain-containing protein, partial [Planctomycetes bacterium]|nr:BatA domain-containing protein [Planctomycetota bacterium]